MGQPAIRGPAAGEPVSRMRWGMIALAFAATLINYLDRQAFSVAAPVLRDAFHLSNVAYSRVVFAFLLAYTLMNGLSGVILDRIGTFAGYVLRMAWWSAAAMPHAVCTGAWSFGAARFLLGIGEAGNWPAAVKVVAEWFPPRERALASGIFNSGASVDAIVAPPLIAAAIPSALSFGRPRPSFDRFVGTMPLYDSPALKRRAAVHRGLITHRLLPAVRLSLLADSHGASRFSRVKFLCMRGVFDSAGPVMRSRCRAPPCCLPYSVTPSAP